jgi:molybdopterin molybdotransferase
LNHTHEGFQRLTSVDEALARFLKSVENRRFKTELVHVMQALDRVLAEDVVAQHEIPFFDRSVVDGFAVRSVVAEGATKGKPSVLEIVGESRLGEVYKGIVGERCTVAVATGSIVPKGADTIVPIEDTLQLPERRISLTRTAIRGQNILRKGEDVCRGKIVLESGGRLRAQDLGVLKTLGTERVRVVKRPRVAVLSTGNELVETLRIRSSSQIVDINRMVLSAKINELNGDVLDLGIVKDRKEVIISTLKRAVKLSDLVLVSGGSSVGQRDLVPSCISSLGKPGMLVHGVAMRPAMPTGLASVNGTPIISLPGFPVSAMFAFLVFGRPMIAKLSGMKEVPESKREAMLAEPIKGWKSFRTFVRVTLKTTAGRLTAVPVESQRSSVIMSIVAADGFVTVPEDTGELPAGQIVEVTLLN